MGWLVFPLKGRGWGWGIGGGGGGLEGGGGQLIWLVTAD